KIDCRGGNTQIGKVLSEARREAVASAVRAVVFVGDAMEESVDDLCAKAGELGLLKVPMFMFQEGHDPTAERAFREIARLTGGAWCRFDPGAAAQLRELLRAAAAYAAGGREALKRLSSSGSGAAKLLGQMKGSSQGARITPATSWRRSTPPERGRRAIMLFGVRVTIMIPCPP